MVCPLCGTRRARRACPAVGHQICAVCCGTKRLVDIRCPPDCPYLTAAREHPAAAVVRRQQRDLDRLVEHTRDLSDGQAQLFFLMNTLLLRFEAPELQPLRDEDVGEAAAALAGTLETAARGVIYEHRPATLTADRLVATLKSALAEAGGTGGTAFDRDAAVVLRRIEAAVRDLHAAAEASHPAPRPYLDLLRRVMAAPDVPGQTGPAEGPGDRRLIVP